MSKPRTITRREYLAADPRHAEEIYACNCEGKDPLTPEQARNIARRGRVPLKPYRCPCCGAWHVAGVSRRARR